MPRYATLAELCAAMRDGQLDPETFTLVIDNDHVGAYSNDRSDGYDDAEPLLELHPAELMTQALDQLGIPYEPA
jgi:hypothetical protein